MHRATDLLRHVLTIHTSITGSAEQSLLESPDDVIDEKGVMPEPRSRLFRRFSSYVPTTPGPLQPPKSSCVTPPRTPTIIPSTPTCEQDNSPYSYVSPHYPQHSLETLSLPKARNWNEAQEGNNRYEIPKTNYMDHDVFSAMIRRTFWSKPMRGKPNVPGKSMINRSSTAEGRFDDNIMYRRVSCVSDIPSSPETVSPFTGPNGISLGANIRRCDIVFHGVIGKGAFGEVHKGFLQGHPVAVKIVKKRRGSGIHREILQAERLAFSMKLRHDNIVNIIGVNMCEGVRGDALIVMEMVTQRTLQNVLDDINSYIRISERLQFAIQITKGLRYLHKNEVVHLDVKPRNVLMTVDNICKLADFGSLTRTCGSEKEEPAYTQLIGTLAYRAPELMKGCFPSCKADIYSLGITLWQMVTRETPYSGADPHWLIYQVIKGNKRPDPFDTGSDINEVKYCALYCTCWQTDPTKRPTAAEVLTTLRNLLGFCWEGDWNENLTAESVDQF